MFVLMACSNGAWAVHAQEYLDTVGCRYMPEAVIYVNNQQLVGNRTQVTEGTHNLKVMGQHPV
jgi:hypothetical protein